MLKFDDTVKALLKLLLSKITSRPGGNGTGFGPAKKLGNPNMVWFVAVGLTWAIAVKFNGHWWLARTMLSRIDSLRARSKLRSMVSERGWTGSTTAHPLRTTASNPPMTNPRYYMTSESRSLLIFRESWSPIKYRSFTVAGATHVPVNFEFSTAV